jgi:hypothetical protein
VSADRIAWAVRKMIERDPATASATVIDATGVDVAGWVRQADMDALSSLVVAPPWPLAVIGIVTPSGAGGLTVLMAEPVASTPTGESRGWDVGVVAWAFPPPGQALRQQVSPLAEAAFLVNADGTVGDFQHPDSADPHVVASTLLDALYVLNLCNCSNVEVMEPTGRPRAQRRRLERIGVCVQEIHIRPPGSGRRAVPRRLADVLAVSGGAAAVRGHFATYGAEGRGLLFGRYAGRFWIPPHVRGAGEAAPRTYVVHDHPTAPGATAP